MTVTDATPKTAILARYKTWEEAEPRADGIAAEYARLSDEASR